MPFIAPKKYQDEMEQQNFEWGFGNAVNNFKLLGSRELVDRIPRMKSKNDKERKGDLQNWNCGVAYIEGYYELLSQISRPAWEELTGGK
jgi:hypothetical protein